MGIKYDVVATLGKYEKDGETKYISRKVGAVIETKHGLSVKLDAIFNPAGCERGEDGSVWLKLFEPRENNVKDIQWREQQVRQQVRSVFDDEIPF